MANKNINNKPIAARRRRKKVALWSLFVLLAAVLAAPFTAYLLPEDVLAQTAQETNERANFWRAVRQGERGYSAVKGPEADVLINNEGQNWRALRNGPVAYYGAWAILGMLGLIIVFYILRGRVRIDGGREGMTVERWTLFDRALHWYTAILFIVLALTGLSLLYGRALLIPYIGKDMFALYASIAKDLHNYLGPFFAVGLVLELLKWIRYNFPTFTDIVWFFKGGGIIGYAHPSAGRMNAGEKVWFWLLFWFGLALIASGFVLNFPGYGQTREIMQYSQLIHLVAGLVLIAVAIGHIYIGTLGTEGALEGMVTGRVDTEWARQHHDKWYDDLLHKKGVQPVKTPDT